MRPITVDSFNFRMVCCNRKHRREVLWNVYYFRSLFGSTESWIYNTEFLRFLDKRYLLQLKYFFKVRFACEIKLILPKCANVQILPSSASGKKSCLNNVFFIRWKRHAFTKRDVNYSFFIAFIFWKLVSLLTYICYDWCVFVYQNIQNSNPFKNKLSKHMRTPNLFEAYASANRKL